MSGLPRALAPWAALLAPLADDLQPAVGEWARRIDAALGPAARTRAEAGEPDGFSGISRRGAYERLLLTEWLLARELPDEFTRRAVMGEHLFLDRARRSLGAPQGVSVLLDAGPDQLGTPRIAQLALLVVLAVRAEAASAGFTWGVLQDEAQQVHRGLDEDGVRRLLHARSRTPASAALAAAWAAVEGFLGEGEPWLVGGERFLGLFGTGIGPGGAGPAARVRIDDVEHPAERAVRLELRRRGVAARELSLPLPPAPTCTRLLRDPFRPVPEVARLPRPARPAQASPTLDARVDPRGGILFSPRGDRAAVRLKSGVILDLHVPSSEAQRAGHARRRRISSGFLAFGWSARGGRHATAEIEAVKPEEQRLRVWTGRAEWPVALSREEDGAPAIPDHAGPLHLLVEWDRPGGRAEHLFLDGARTLHLVSRERSAGVARDVAAFELAPGPVALVIHNAQVWLYRHGSEFIPQSLGPCAGRALLGRWAGGLAGAFEERRGGTWSVFPLDPAVGARAVRQYQPFPGMKVVGLVARGRFAPVCHSDAPALLALDADGVTFAALGTFGARKVHVADAPVATAAVDPTGRVLGYLTAAGDLVFHSLWSGQRVLRRQFEASR